MSMLWFSEKRKDLICNSLNEAWKLAEEISEMANAQTADGIEDLESAKIIKYGKKTSEAISELGAKYSGKGIEFSEHASSLREELKTIAKIYGCKLKPGSR